MITIITRTLSFVDQKSIGSPHIYEVTNLHGFQVLGHFPTLWELRMNILEINLNEKESLNVSSSNLKKKRKKRGMVQRLCDHSGKQYLRFDWNLVFACILAAGP